MKKKKDYTVPELIEHFKWIQRQAVMMGLLLDQEDCNKSFAIVDKLQELISKQ